MSEDVLRANGTFVKERRIIRGWTQEDLARKAGCSKRTIENVESGKPIAVRTLHEVAQALEVSPGELRYPDTRPPEDSCQEPVPEPVESAQSGPGDEERNGNICVSTGVAYIDIVIDRDFSSFTGEDQERFLRLFKAALGLSDDIRVLRKRPGSVVLTLELTPEEAERLYAAVKRGQFAEWGIVDARKAEEPEAATGIPKQPGGSLEELPLTDPLTEREFAALSEEGKMLGQAAEPESFNTSMRWTQREQGVDRKFDPLTGLFNRRSMDRLAELEIRRRSDYPSPVALGLVDADHFKQINDRYLYPGGDMVLIELANTFTGVQRPKACSVGRVGGEEFLVVAPETSLEEAASLGERIRAAVENSTYYFKGEPIRVTVSIGFAVAEAGVAVDYEKLKQLAAAALAEAKSQGRNRCVVKPVS
jgi:diguanylate cyclase (GGDEF)-like protein